MTDSDVSEPNEPLWITYDQAIAIHSRQLRRFGGAPGLRDEGMLRSALERPINKWRYEQADLAEQAAAYAFGLAKNHAFVDGNKRIGVAAAEFFLERNGQRLEASDDDFEAMTFAVAEGKAPVEALAIWFRQRLRSVD